MKLKEQQKKLHFLLYRITHGQLKHIKSGSNNF